MRVHEPGAPLYLLIEPSLGLTANSPAPPPYSRVAAPPTTVHEPGVPFQTETSPLSRARPYRALPVTANESAGPPMRVHEPAAPLYLLIDPSLGLTANSP